jgi:hypothetical protein
VELLLEPSLQHIMDSAAAHFFYCLYTAVFCCLCILQVAAVNIFNIMNLVTMTSDENVMVWGFLFCKCHIYCFESSRIFESSRRIFESLLFRGVANRAMRNLLTCYSVHLASSMTKIIICFIMMLRTKVWFCFATRG